MLSHLRRARARAGWPASTARRCVSAPPGTLITGGTLVRQMLDYHFEGGKVGSSYGFGYWLRTADGQTIERCGGAGSPPPDGCLPQPDGLARFANPVRQLTATKGPPPGTDRHRRAAHRARLLPRPQLPRAAAACVTSTPAARALGISQMALRVSETEAPIVRSVAGSLLSDAPVRARDIAINASDTGLGLFRLLVYVDGTLTEAQPFDAVAARLRRPQPRQPRPLRAARRLRLPHRLDLAQLLARRPARRRPARRPRRRRGRRRQRHHRPRSAPSPSPCPSTGCAAPPTAASCPARHPTGPTPPPTPRLKATTMGRTRRRVSQGQRTMIAGTLTNPAGAPITDAAVDVQSLVDVTRRGLAAGGQRPHRRATAASATPSPSAPPARFRFAYRTHVGDAEPARIAEVRIAVRAGVTRQGAPAVRAPRRPRPRQRTPPRQPASRAPARVVELQALDGREWRTFKTLPVHRRGRFAYRYRFRHTTRNARFLWRIYVRKQAGLPYAAAASRPVWVVVRP